MAWFTVRKDLHKGGTPRSGQLRVNNQKVKPTRKARQQSPWVASPPKSRRKKGGWW